MLAEHLMTRQEKIDRASDESRQFRTAAAARLRERLRAASVETRSHLTVVK